MCVCVLVCVCVCVCVCASVLGVLFLIVAVAIAFSTIRSFRVFVVVFSWFLLKNKQTTQPLDPGLWIPDNQTLWYRHCSVDAHGRDMTTITAAFSAAET